MDYSDNPIKVFRELVGEGNLTTTQRENLDRMEAYADETIEVVSCKLIGGRRNGEVSIIEVGKMQFISHYMDEADGQIKSEVYVRCGRDESGTLIFKYDANSMTAKVINERS